MVKFDMLNKMEDVCLFYELSCVNYVSFFFFKQKTAYEMCGRDWSSDVCSSDLTLPVPLSCTSLPGPLSE